MAKYRGPDRCGMQAILPVRREGGFAVENALFRMARLIFKSGFADAEAMACKQKLFISILPFFMKNR